MARKNLTVKERRFVEAFMGPSRGNATQAAHVAGYGRTTASARQLGYRLLTKVHIRAAIHAYQNRETQAAVATAEELDIIVTRIIRDVLASPMDRIRAISELNRVQGRYRFNVKHSGGMTLEQLVAGSRQIDR